MTTAIVEQTYTLKDINAFIARTEPRVEKAQKMLSLCRKAKTILHPQAGIKVCDKCLAYVEKIIEDTDDVLWACRRGSGSRKIDKFHDTLVNIREDFNDVRWALHHNVNSPKGIRYISLREKAVSIIQDCNLAYTREQYNTLDRLLRIALPPHTILPQASTLLVANAGKLIVFQYRDKDYGKDRKDRQFVHTLPMNDGLAQKLKLCLRAMYFGDIGKVLLGL